MSDEPQMSRMKIAPQLIGIVALAALFFACFRGEHGHEGPLELATRRLRVGMTFDEAYAIVGEPGAAEGSPRYWNAYYSDPETAAEIRLHFDRHRLTEWHIDPQR